MEIDKEKILYDYQERLAIGMVEGCLFSVNAKKQARNQIYRDLERSGIKRSEAVYLLYKLLEETTEPVQ